MSTKPGLPQPQIELTAEQNAIAMAKQSEVAAGIPWQLTVAQWALESGWGKHQPGWNAFGIKAYVGSYGIQYLPTKEWVNGVERTFSLPFATFPTLMDCFIKHGELISQGTPYSAAMKKWKKDPNRTPCSLAKLIGPIYATDPTYATQLCEIIAELGV